MPAPRADPKWLNVLTDHCRLAVRAHAPSLVPRPRRRRRRFRCMNNEMVKVDPEEMNERHSAGSKKVGWRERIGHGRKGKSGRSHIARSQSQRRGDKKRARLRRSFSAAQQKEARLPAISSQLRQAGRQAGYYRSLGSAAHSIVVNVSVGR